MKRVVYSVETKYKVVEMKIKRYRTRETMDTLNIKNESQVKNDRVHRSFYWGINSKEEKIKQPF